MGDQGVGSEAKDVVKDFNVSDGDKLDLSDLLPEEAADALSDYLEVDNVLGDNKTVINIKTAGNAAGAVVDQIITLDGVELSEQDIINSLILKNTNNSSI